MLRANVSRLPPNSVGPSVEPNWYRHLVRVSSYTPFLGPRIIVGLPEEFNPRLLMNLPTSLALKHGSINALCRVDLVLSVTFREPVFARKLAHGGRN